jgi:hypothetical protein
MMPFRVSAITFIKYKIGESNNLKVFPNLSMNFKEFIMLEIIKYSKAASVV